jgi:hypothetical protein
MGASECVDNRARRVAACSRKPLLRPNPDPTPTQLRQLRDYDPTQGVSGSFPRVSSPTTTSAITYPLPYPATVVHCNWTCGVDTTQEAVKVRPVGLAYVTATGGEPTPKFAPESVTRVPPSVANVIAGLQHASEGVARKDSMRTLNENCPVRRRSCRASLRL